MSSHDLDNDGVVNATEFLTEELLVKVSVCVSPWLRVCVLVQSSMYVCVVQSSRR